ncbi:hypothetical protein BDV96DRAFT_152553 [Lophiotrema nucula]|uniref:PH domain-containing protein n=1 Tax=Lophiotrema nucula TaxID=690887 RepID=A0A6A5Z0I2_9PLEO|nr:hypothetical protein BDV96DRAFT_152553 [Lophiotrema nucula]
MATMANPPPGAFALDNGSDPFVSNPQDAHRQRFGNAFDNTQFSLYLSGSPAQAKRALEAHLQETKRRLEDAQHVGVTLVQQRKELEEKIQEVEKHQEDNDIGPELRQRLAELEKEFHDVGRDSARAFLPKSRVPSGETDATAGASVYSSEALHSPSKVSVPSRKQRNQQSSRINDIALATEISTSLLAQLKELQAVLLEKDDALKAANLDRSQLEIEVEGLSQRLRTIDESESRLKDVNWGLETQVRDFEASSRAAADKENRMNHNLNLIRSEKAQIEREFEDLKSAFAKLQDDHTSKSKLHETELTGLRRNVSMGETERSAMQRKLDDLAAQNTDLARAMRVRFQGDDQMSADDVSPDDGAEEGNTITPEHSPPPSPSKATPRHGGLESETLKHSLHHAHRMIQQLKNNIHREKTEKIELKRMLQDARDELESNRNSMNGSGSATKRRKNDKDVFKKPARPDRLGALRTGSHEIIADDDEWEEQEALQNTPSRRLRLRDSVPGAFPGGFTSGAETSTDAFETANETSDAFETANERDGTATETDAFQTGAETLDGDSTDDLTETEDGPTASTVRAARPSPLAIVGNRNSYQSTASTSGDDDDDLDVKTPIQSQHPRYRLKMRQGGYRRSPRGSQEILASTPPIAKDSPASLASNNSTPAQGKSLFAELGNFSGESEDGSVADGTPSRISLLSPDSSPEVQRRSVLGKSPLQEVSMPKVAMVDSGMMTEAWEPEESLKDVPSVTHMGVGTDPQTPKRLAVSSIATQDTQPASPELQRAVPSSLFFSSHSTQHTIPESPTVQKELPPVLNISSISAHGTEPVVPVIEKVVAPSLNLSSIGHQHTEPRIPVKAPLHVSSLASQATEPLDPPRPVPVVDTTRSAPMLVSSVSTQSTEPFHSPEQAHSLEDNKHRPLYVSSLSMQATEPMAPPKAAPYQLSMLSSQASEPVAAYRATPQLSLHTSQGTEPVEPHKPARPQLSSLYSQCTDPVETPRRAPSQVSVINVQHTKPVEKAVVRPPKNRFSDVMVLQDTQPESPTLPAFLPSPTSRPSTAHRVPRITLNMSDIFSQETEPKVPSRPVTAHRDVPLAMSASSSSVQTEPQKAAKSEAGKLGFFSAFSPWSKAESETSRDMDATTPPSRDGRMPLAPIASNAVQSARTPSPPKVPHTPTAESGTQTMVSADQIDKLLAARMQRYSGSIAAAGVEKRMSPPASPRRLSNEPQKSPRRPGSSGSIRSRAASPPPLPADHKEVIAALRSSHSGAPPATPGTMGPPTIPASAYKKRPGTPSVRSNIVTSPKTGGTTPRARHAPRSDHGRSGASSPVTMTRRSSVSSFTSEIDQRFNISSMPFGPGGLGSGIDERMLQAIVQTMGGEFMWKYTRKPGREATSENRHRRFFWVHPYTRTLYWSEHDPGMERKFQMKAKSVAIESVEVVTDDNVYPPGLYRKSIVVYAPGRSIKFTAPTSQRHETWFNALSYLLMRTDNEGESQQEYTDEIQAEFNAGHRSSSRMTGRSRASMASYVTRRTSSPHYAGTPTLRASNSYQSATAEPNQASMSGRLSSMSGRFRQSMGLRGSFSSRHSGVSAQSASVQEYQPSTSVEDLTRDMMRTSNHEELLNVRACCDGKHDVGHLHHHHVSQKDHHNSSRSRASLIGSMSSRSHSRADSRKDGQ